MTIINRIRKFVRYFRIRVFFRYFSFYYFKTYLRENILELIIWDIKRDARKGVDKNIEVIRRNYLEGEFDSEKVREGVRREYWDYTSGKALMEAETYLNSLLLGYLTGNTLDTFLFDIYYVNYGDSILNIEKKIQISLN